ncbi:NAD(P)-binding protein [Setomelanomma holmii]|uniref:NAD(P)-binding protein n=1 Tax=Setomelanomma holmii TaxID=210430 RepID=A0A9P4H613_9PLEO|nr:NAD(P)-binding protein [Setomelanomma holmii]
MSTPVLIFGPTGGVGSAAALKAHELGAHVYLAMRDPNKSIPGISNPQDGYTRIQADLSDPASLTSAVKTSGAKAAFLYVVHQSPDSMASSFSALKEAGVEYVVLLSSVTVHGDASDPKNHENFIAGVHAKTEVALRDSGLAYTAIRPAQFATNILWNQKDIKAGHVDLLYPDIKFDYITPRDMGIVSATVLVQRPKGLPDNAIVLCGPQLISQREAHGVIGKVLGKEIVVNDLSEEQWREKMSHMPGPILDTLVNGMREHAAGKGLIDEEGYRKAVENLKEWTGGEGLGFEGWVRENGGLFE